MRVWISPVFLCFICLTGCVTPHYLVPADGNFVPTDGQTAYTEVPSINRYTEPIESGLVVSRPYPGPAHVCRVVRETTLTAPYVREDMVLIACPKHEVGAISDRMAEGAIMAAFAKHWVLLHLPLEADQNEAGVERKPNQSERKERSMPSRRLGNSPHEDIRGV